ncbi:hypothetical protein A2239_01565 [Candidatus Uhrbacteria bacterium RIFOXYA2_FULL_40_9]|nr:MAG: hypothetical protein A2239_01565 [Candidatus Uhrbacteria bacterium RIFOXYA2_FULL_40_9]
MSHEIVEKFSTHLKNALTKALTFAVEQGQESIQPEVLFWAIGTESGCVAAEILKKAQVKKNLMNRLVLSLPKQKNLTPSNELTLELSKEAKRAVEKAVLTASAHGHSYVGTEHLLSGLLQIHPTHLMHFFEKEKIDLSLIRHQLSLVLNGTSHFPKLTEHLSPEDSEETPLQESPEKKTSALEYFGRDLTSEEFHKKIDPVIGREEEIQRLMEILCRRTKNNPLLIGEPGVGKTAIVEGLAKRIAEQKVPAPLQHKHLIALDLAHVVAGTMYRGEFEARLKQIIEEVQEDPDVILFIDEIHALVGAGSASGSMDAASILKPALARGEIHCIGATTLAEYKKFIETDRALERRFQSVLIKEPDSQKTREILKGVAPYYESYHGVRISSEAIDSAVSFSERYIQHNQLPDKALDLLDEALACVRVSQTEINPQTEHHYLLKRQLQETQEAKKQAVLSEQFDEALLLKKEEDHLAMSLQNCSPATSPVIDYTITKQDIARVVSRITGIPLKDILSEQEGFEHLEEELCRSILGQPSAVSLIAQALRRAKSGLSEPNRPLASFLFLGPSGVGKTEMAKVISQTLFQEKKSLVRLDMSEYAEGFSLSKLLGAPAGYVGYQDRAKLTDQIKQHPHSVVLFDELEKAHPDVQNILLQILEEGEITDATGRTVNFRNAIVVLTSNVGLERFQRAGMGFVHDQTAEQQLLLADLRKELEERFRPELINRVDHLCLFKPLTREVLEQIAQKQLEELVSRLKTQNVHITIQKEIATFICKQANPLYGARDVRRQIQTHIEHAIAERILKNTGRSFTIKLRGKTLSVVQTRP